MAEDKSRLNEEEIVAQVQALQGWQRHGIMIRRDFVMANFSDITAFLQHLVGTIAAQNHHPDFSLDTGTRTIAVAVTTHSEGGLTRSDIDFAQALNAWAPTV